MLLSWIGWMPPIFHVNASTGSDQVAHSREVRLRLPFQTANADLLLKFKAVCLVLRPSDVITHIARTNALFNTGKAHPPKCLPRQTKLRVLDLTYLRLHHPPHTSIYASISFHISIRHCFVSHTPVPISHRASFVRTSFTCPVSATSAHMAYSLPLLSPS
jgi:hypothetical protein